MAERAGHRVVGQRRQRDAGNDRPRLLVARRENEREQLRLVAHLAERDDGGRPPERFQHDYFLRNPSAITAPTTISAPVNCSGVTTWPSTAHASSNAATGSMLRIG